MNRRSFLQRLGAGALLLAFQWPLIARPMDRRAFRDDTEYLQALFDAGEPIPRGTYIQTRPLFFNRPYNFNGNDSEFIARPNT